MLDPSIFHPRNPGCKSPFGAVAAGTGVTLTLRPPRSLGCTRVWLTLRWEQWDGHTETLPVPWVDTCLGTDVYRRTFSVPENYQGLVWYSFALERGPGAAAILSSDYQLTVYDGTESVPAWFGSGMSYQLFPDRFCRLEVPQPVGPGRRIVHQDWFDEPIYRPEENGQVTNRDFFGGSLAGIESKLDYLASLGVETIYLNPIFEGVENHRYGTGDYEKIDPLLGDEAAFSSLCRAAHRRNIRIILDGVFNHVGSVSKYFNADGTYGPGGAARDPNSPYRSWFKFRHWPDEYDSWWGFKTLPDLNENDPGYREYLCGENGIVRRWLRLGADGWRLDVADELPDDFIRQIHAAARAENPNAVIIGEVWEDGSTKMAYNVRRKHILGRHCDGLMNYPLRGAMLGYLLGGSAADFAETMETLREHYPPFAFHNSMNFLGTHDTPRILTLLGVGSDWRDGHSKDDRAAYVMSPEETAHSLALYRIGLTLLFAFPGSPTVYYGDEAGLTGFEDPFNRKTYPWGRENQSLVEFTARLGQLRRDSPALRDGAIEYLCAQGGLLAFRRGEGTGAIVAAANREDAAATLSLPWATKDLLSGAAFSGPVTLPPKSAFLLAQA